MIVIVVVFRSKITLVVGDGACSSIASRRRRKTFARNIVLSVVMCVHVLTPFACESVSDFASINV